MKVRAWKEFGERRVIPTPDGPVIANKGEIVMVVVRETWEEMAVVMANLDQRPEGG